MNALFAERFDGAEAWAKLSPEEQAQIGKLTLELVAAWHGCDTYQRPVDGHDRPCRPFETVELNLLLALKSVVQIVVPELNAADRPPVPSLLGQVCRYCGCSKYDGCEPPCSWAQPDLCSACDTAREPTS